MLSDIIGSPVCILVTGGLPVLILQTKSFWVKSFGITTHWSSCCTCWLSLEMQVDNVDLFVATTSGIHSSPSLARYRINLASPWTNVLAFDWAGE